MKDSGRTARAASLPKFMQRAMRHGINTREEERKLATRAGRLPFKHRDAEEARRAREKLRAAYRARDELVTTNLRFILKQSLRHSRYDRTEPDDAFQEAVIGHLEAVSRFDTGAGTRLSTYSSWWIRHAVARHGHDHGRDVRVPVRVYELARKISAAAQRFERTHGRLPDDDELSALTGIARGRIDDVRIAVMEAASLDAPRQDEEGNGRSLRDQVPSPADDPETEVVRDRETAALKRAMGALTPFEAAVIRCRFYEDKTLIETAKALAGDTRRGEELSRERIRQIEAAAIAKLRDALD